MNRFKVFWFARTFSFFGDFVFTMTIVWFAMEQGGAWEVATVSSASLLFRTFGSFLLVPLINRLGGRLSIVYSDMLRALCNVLLWLLVFQKNGHPSVTIAMVAVNSFIAGGFDGGMQLFIPTIASELRKANADLSSGRSTMQLLGFLIGGAMWQFFSGYGFLVNALTFVVAGVISSYIRGEATVEEKKISRDKTGGAFRKFTENWRFAWKTLQASPTLRLTFWTTLIINAFIPPMLSLMAPLVKEVVGGGSIVYSLVQCASMVGSLIGAQIVRRSKWKDGYMLILSSICCGVVGVVAGSSSLAVFLVLTMAIFGFSQSIYNISESTVIQQNEPQLRASIFGIMQVAGIVLFPVMSISLATLSNITSIRLPFLIGGVIVIVSTIFLAWRWFVAEASNRTTEPTQENAEVPL